MSTSAHSECGTLVIHVDMRSLPVKRATKAGTVTERYPADRRVPCRPESPTLLTRSRSLEEAHRVPKVSCFA